MVIKPKYFFEIHENVERLKTFLKAWIGTPYKHHSGVKGLECDCIHLIYRGCEALALRVPDKIQWYPKDWHLHNKEELLLDGLREYLIADELPPENPINGDIVVYKFGHTRSHAGWFMDGHIIQALVGIGVEARTWNDRYWNRRKSLIFRILNNG